MGSSRAVKCKIQFFGFFFLKIKWQFRSNLPNSGVGLDKISSPEAILLYRPRDHRRPRSGIAYGIPVPSPNLSPSPDWTYRYVATDMPNLTRLTVRTTHYHTPKCSHGPYMHLCSANTSRTSHLQQSRKPAINRSARPRSTKGAASRVEPTDPS